MINKSMMKRLKVQTDNLCPDHSISHEPTCEKCIYHAGKVAEKLISDRKEKEVLIDDIG